MQIYVLTHLMDFGDDTTSRVVGLYQFSDTAKKAAKEEMESILCDYRKDFPRESLDISGWDDENPDEKVLQVTADEGAGAYISGLVLEYRITRMTVNQR